MVGKEILYKLLKTQSYERLTEFLRHILNEKQIIPIDIKEFINAKNWEVFLKIILKIMNFSFSNKGAFAAFFQ